jgi:NAD(P)-dependent dehydrogenase (short-subunit alcohol dehydrogenase family)
MTGALQDRVCIVTGAARGIGQAYAERFAREGARVVVIDLLALDDTIELCNGAALPITCDICSRTETHDAVQQIVRRWGRVDVLLNNAAYYGGIRHQPFDEISESEWDTAMQVNVKGTWLMSAAAVAQMRQQESGKIINISSNVVSMGRPEFLHYVASKGAVWAMTNALSRELAHTGITVNAIAPGYTITAATRGRTDEEAVVELERRIVASQSVGRLMAPGDLVGTAVFLASSDSDFLTGQTLTVDGGVTVG